MKIAIKTLGCKVNQSESASIAGSLRSKGYEVVSDTENPDVCIVNTCTVTSKSDYQSRQMIRRAAKRGAKVVVTGCYAQMKTDELARIDGVVLVTGNSGKDELINNIQNLSVVGKPIINVTPPVHPITINPYYSNRTRAFLKIQDGCNLSCSYCTVPMARGKSRSLKPDNVLTVVERLCLEGYNEIVLTGIHIGTYGLDLLPESSLLEIVDKIVSLYPQIRLRLSSIEPQEFKKDFLRLIEKGSVCPHLHIPLQSGSDRILKAMKRGYNKLFFKELINESVLSCPHLSIGTDIIVGFPGESERDFEETVELLEDLHLSYIHVFTYSKRPNTQAESFPEHINEDVKRKRANIVLRIAEEKRKNYISRYLGKKLDVIVEGKATTNGFYRAISDNYIRPIIKADGLYSGQRLSVVGLSLNNENLLCKNTS